MIGKTLKYMIVALAALITCMEAAGCPTCVGRLRLGVKKPFFMLYRPHSRSLYAKKRDLLHEALSHKTTEASKDKTWSKKLIENRGKV